MIRIAYNGVWSFSLAAAIVACARYFHPATFSPVIFPSLVFLALLCAAISVAMRRYE